MAGCPGCRRTREIRCFDAGNYSAAGLVSVLADDCFSGSVLLGLGSALLELGFVLSYWDWARAGLGLG